jgi:hypothetical protein
MNYLILAGLKECEKNLVRVQEKESSSLEKRVL